MSKEFLRGSNNTLPSTEEVSDYESSIPDSEQNVQAWFALDKDKYAPFLQNGYHMQNLKPNEPISKPRGCANFVSKARLGEYKCTFL